MRRRAWLEPHVRFWWVLTLVLLAIGAYVGGSQWLVWSREVWLVRSGRVVDAEIMTAGGLSSRWQQLPPNSIVTLRYEVDGKTYDQVGYLKGRTEFIQVHSKVPVRIDRVYKSKARRRAGKFEPNSCDARPAGTIEAGLRGVCNIEADDPEAGVAGGRAPLHLDRHIGAVSGTRDEGGRRTRRPDTPHEMR